ncbi:alpha/beta hydrolase [Bacillus spongiae]|uniref:Alpha/beta hydrolase n=1 Tax=Bacillus spongiae TaxID=2683610 RepID=A0ABU8H8N5_9BACI
MEEVSFQSLVDPLVKDVKMVYLDQRGCGRSQHDPQRNYSLPRLIEDMEEVREQLQIDKWFVMGHSFGGILATNYAYRYPERTKGLILINATLNMKASFQHLINKGLDQLGKRNEELVQEDSTKAIVENANKVIRTLIERKKYDQLQFVNEKNKQNVDQLDVGIQSDPHFQSTVFSSEEYFQNFTQLTAKINHPTLIISGEYDDAIGPHHYQAFQFKHAVVHQLKSAHHPYLENQEEFQNIINQYFKEHA